jgi:NADPH:quinone reductase-like Zn-dependent oxidoreductase
VGKDTWAKSLRSLRRGGRVVTCGTTSGTFIEQDIRYLYRQHLSVLGSSMGTHREMRAILDLIGLGKLRPVIHGILPLREAAEAHRMLAARAQFGKVLLVP